MSSEHCQWPCPTDAKRPSCTWTVSDAIWSKDSCWEPCAGELWGICRLHPLLSHNSVFSVGDIAGILVHTHLWSILEECVGIILKVGFWTWGNAHCWMGPQQNGTNSVANKSIQKVSLPQLFAIGFLLLYRTRFQSQFFQVERYLKFCPLHF